MTNREVATRWAEGLHARSANMWTDGKRLYSYGLCIAAVGPQNHLV